MKSDFSKQFCRTILYDSVKSFSNSILIQVFSCDAVSKKSSYRNSPEIIRKKVQTLPYETKTIEYHGKDTDGVRNLVISFFRKFLIDQFVNFKLSENSSNETKVT